MGKHSGIVVCDIDEDGWLDFVVANDTVPNWLFRNNAMARSPSRQLSWASLMRIVASEGRHGDRHR